MTVTLRSDPPSFDHLGTHAYTHTCTHAYTHVHRHTCIHTHVHMHTPSYTHMLTHTCTPAYTHHTHARATRSSMNKVGTFVDYTLIRAEVSHRRKADSERRVTFLYTESEWHRGDVYNC